MLEQPPTIQDEQILEAYRFVAEVNQKQKTIDRLAEYTAPELIQAWQLKLNKKVNRLKKLFKENVEALDILSAIN